MSFTTILIIVHSLLFTTGIVTALPEPAYGAPIREDEGPITDGLGKILSLERRRLVLVHAIFGALAWLVFAPVAIISARYFKSRFRDADGRMWFRIHFTMNSMTVVSMVLTFVLGYFAVVPGSKHQFVNPHLQIGVAVFAATCMQALIGVLNHYVILPMRYSRAPLKTPFVNKVHILLGWLTWGLGIANIPVGMVLYGSPIRLFTFYGVFMTALLLVLVYLEATYGRDSCTVRKGNDEENRVSSPKGKRTRSLHSTESVLPAGVEKNQSNIRTRPTEGAAEGNPEKLTEMGQTAGSEPTTRAQQVPKHPGIKEANLNPQMAGKQSAGFAEAPADHEVAERIKGTEQQKGKAPSSVVRV